VIGGTAYTVKLARKHKKAYLVVDLAQPADPEPVQAGLVQNRITTLNVAGPRESKVPRIHDRSFDYLVKALGQQDKKWTSHHMDRGGEGQDRTLALS
jgi:hypothetical protein